MSFNSSRAQNQPHTFVKIHFVTPVSTVAMSCKKCVSKNGIASVNIGEFLLQANDKRLCFEL